MKNILKLKRVHFLWLLPLSFLLVFIAKQSVYFAEYIFALHIYKWISQIISLITNVFPLSIAELMVIVAPILITFILVRFIIKLVKDKKNLWYNLGYGLLNLSCVVSIALFLFVILAGINYYRYSFSVYSNLVVRDSSLEELYLLTEELAREANHVRQMVAAEDEEGVFALSSSIFELADLVEEAMSELGKEYQVLSGHYGAPKPIFVSPLMSYTEITGIFFPFTMEANVNVDIPDYSIPSTMLHELAHLRGFMREDEANYIAYLAGAQSSNIDIKYSSTMLALIISGNALYRENSDMYFEIRDQYSEELVRDIRANSAYWAKYEDTVISTVSSKINDTYLKANNQTDGVKSYGRMVDLLLAKYRKDYDL
ncbi:MAG TPA: DUF3810 domain-containing protein [Clostridiales bacterium]|nr:DUF3810 domain-containing protein [Clostridiales bacterium]